MKLYLLSILFFLSFIGTTIAQDTSSSDTSTTVIKFRCHNPNPEKPLYIIDGVQVNDISNLNPRRIRQIKVIKSKKAIRKYGSEAKAGVVLIKTRRKRKRPRRFLIKKLFVRF